MKKYVKRSSRVCIPITGVVVYDLDTNVAYHYATKSLAQENHGFRVGSHPKLFTQRGHFSWKFRAFAWPVDYPMPNKLKYYKKFWQYLLKIEADIGAPLNARDNVFAANTLRRIHQRCYTFFGLEPGKQCAPGTRHTEKSLNGI